MLWPEEMESRWVASEKLASEQGRILTELQKDLTYIKENMLDMRQIKELIMECLQSKEKKKSAHEEESSVNKNAESSEEDEVKGSNKGEDEDLLRSWLKKVEEPNSCIKKEPSSTWAAKAASPKLLLEKVQEEPEKETEIEHDPMLKGFEAEKMVEKIEVEEGGNSGEVHRFHNLMVMKEKHPKSSMGLDAPMEMGGTLMAHNHPLNLQKQ